MERWLDIMMLLLFVSDEMMLFVARLPLNRWLTVYADDASQPSLHP